jgi:hypothetical protein
MLAAARVSRFSITNLHLFTVGSCSFRTYQPTCIRIGVKNSELARKNETPFRYYVPIYEAKLSSMRLGTCGCRLGLVLGSFI